MEVLLVRAAVSGEPGSMANILHPIAASIAEEGIPHRDHDHMQHRRSMMN